MEDGQGDRHDLHVLGGPPKLSSFFRLQVPYVVAVIDLDEGPRLVSNVLEVGNPDLSLIGKRVRVEWETHESVSIPLFRLI